ARRAAGEEAVGERGDLQQQRLDVDGRGGVGLGAAGRGVDGSQGLPVGQPAAAAQSRGQAEGVAASEAANRTPPSPAGRPRQREFPATAGTPAPLAALTEGFSASRLLMTNRLSYGKPKRMGESTVRVAEVVAVLSVVAERALHELTLARMTLNGELETE